VGPATTLRVVLVENLRRLRSAWPPTRRRANLPTSWPTASRTTAWRPSIDWLRSWASAASPIRFWCSFTSLQDQWAPGLARHREWLQRVLPDPAAVQIQLPAEQAADNLSVSSAIGSLRLIGQADCRDHRSRQRDAADAVDHSDVRSGARRHPRPDAPRDRDARRRSGRSERFVAQALLDLMNKGSPPCDDGIP